MLATAVCAVLAGACTFAATADRVHDLDPPAWATLGFTGRLPVPSTLWRLLTRIDDTALAAVLTCWLRSRITAARAARRRWRRVIAVDGKVLRGARLPDGRQVHLLSAFDTSTGAVLAHVQIAVKSNENSGVHAPVGPGAAQVGCLEGVMFVTDALHAQTDHARQVASRGACLMVAVKAHQPTLFARLTGLPWAQVPVGDRRSQTGHGRRETRTVKGTTTREMAYLTVSLPAQDAQPVDLGSWARSEWHIEKRLHWVLGVTLRKDKHQARTGTGPAVASVLRHTAIGYHRSNGEPDIARATRRANRRSNDLIDAVTSS